MVIIKFQINIFVANHPSSIVRCHLRGDNDSTIEGKMLNKTKIIIFHIRIKEIKYC